MRARAAALMLPMAASAVAFGQAPAQKIETPESISTLGKLEREAVDEALLARNMAVDLSPAGKVVGQIHVFNHDVFSSRDSYFQLLNIFHRTTRENIIRREVLLQPGDTWDQAIVEETVRNLRDSEFSSLVAIVPIVTATPGKVDLLVVTRDVWSLRFNTDFQFDDGGGQQKSVLIYLTTSLSENNLLGWRKRASLVFNLFRGSYEMGPTYYDPNIAGTRLRLSASYVTVFERDAREREGHSLAARLDYPLWSLARKWGGHVSASHADLVFRRFEPHGRGLLQQPIMSVAGMPSVPFIYRYRRSAVDTGGVRSIPTGPVINRVSAGHRFAVIRPRFHDDFPQMDPVVRDAFAAQFFPVSERFSAVYLSYGLFTPRYRVYRDYDTFDLREDSQLGPSFSVYTDRASTAIGSTHASSGLSGSAGWSLDLWDGYQSLGIGWGGRFRGGNFVDESRSVSTTLSTPVLWRVGRLLAQGSLRVLLRNTRPDSYYTVGNEDGLRGYGIAQFAGQARFLGHVEARSRPLAIAALRLGALVFYDVGHAAPSLSDLRAYHDAGVGLRLLIPQLNFYVLRLDWAFPFQRAGVVAAGWPGRVTGGFRQVF